MGNFDPPVTPNGYVGNVGGNLHTNLRNPLDVNADGFVTPLDALVLVTDMTESGARRLVGAATEAPFLDVNIDGFLSPTDALQVVVGLTNNAASGEGESSLSFDTSSRIGAEGEAALPALSQPVARPAAPQTPVSDTGVAASDSAASETVHDIALRTGIASTSPRTLDSIVDDLASDVAKRYGEDVLLDWLGDEEE